MRWLVALLGLLITIPGALPATGGSNTAALSHLRALCAGVDQGRFLAPGQLGRALAAVVGPTPDASVQRVTAAIGGQAYCWGIDIAPPGVTPLILVGEGPDRPGTVLWQQDGAWRAAPSAVLGSHPQWLFQSGHPPRIEVFLADRMPGSGQSGRLVVLQQGDGAWHASLRTDWFGHFHPAVLDGDHILVTARGGWTEFPLAWSANCCVPTSYQWLFQRQGSGFALAAERQAPDPYLTLNAFFGAVAQMGADDAAGSRDTATSWLERLATPAAVAVARHLGLDTRDRTAHLPPDAFRDLRAVQAVELRHWSRLPPGLNGPAPVADTLTIPIDIRGDGQTRLEATLLRAGDRWLVKSLDRTD